MPYFNKLAEGKIPTLPPFTSRQTIRTQDPRNPVTVHIYSKLESSKYEIYKKCGQEETDHNTNLEADITNWVVSDPGNIFCHIDKPYLKNQTREPAMAICIDNNDIFARFNEIAAQVEDSKPIIEIPVQVTFVLKYKIILSVHTYTMSAILYKAPGQATGKIIEATDAARDWQDGAQALSNDDQHSFAKALQHVVGNDQNVKFLAYNNAPPGVANVKTKSNSKAPGQATGKIIEATAAAGNWQDGAALIANDQGHSFATALQHVVRDHQNVKFLAYNNAPPGIPSIKTKSNSKGIIILSNAVNTDSAAWIAHTVPGFPAAKTGYSWPLAENARGHLLICLTILESQINAIAASLLLVQPLIHYNDIPKTETAAMPYFNKLAEGKISTLPPFTSRQTIRTQSGAAPVTVHIYSKSESSKYEIYKKVIVKVLKKTIKVWSRRDSILKGDCRGSQRHIRLIKSPAAINGHNTNLEADITNWAVSDPGNIFCHIDKPYFKNQTREPAMAICIDNNEIFARFNEIAAQVMLRQTGVIILSTAADSAAWIVHTVPGFPTARTPYSWPAAENARGHLLICLTISESQINAIAASLLLVQPMVHYNDIPETETAGMPYFKKLAEGKVPTLPPFTSRRSIRTENAGGPVAVHIYSKSESSKYEIYKKVIVKVLKKTIKVWSRRDNILKGDCRGSQRHIRLIKSPAAINGHNTNLEADITNWAVSDPGNIFCHIDKPYFKNQTREPAMAVCIDNNEIFARFNEIAAQKSRR
ncbi:Deoxyribonuclease-2-alpha, partial [Trichinella sp. T9]